MSSLELLLLVLLLVSWGASIWGYRRLRDSVEELARERVEQVELQTNIARIVGELQLAADELGEALASRTSQLHRLLGEADGRISDAGEMLDALRQGLETAPSPRNGSHTVVHLAPVEMPVPVAAVAPAASPAQAAPVTAPATPPAAAPVMTPVAAPVPVSAYDVARRLAAEGLDAGEIAQRMQRGREEVRLLLQMSQGMRPGAGSGNAGGKSNGRVPATNGRAHNPADNAA